MKTKLTKEELTAITEKAWQNTEKIQKLNASAADPERIRSVLAEVTGEQIDNSVEIRLPIYTDYGANIHFGKDIYISNGVMFTDLGGIYLEDQVLIGPRANIISVDHPTDPKKRRGLELGPVHIQRNAWIGTNATILPGVTIGKNAIVGAGSVVTKDVPANTVVAGVPAKLIKRI